MRRSRRRGEREGRSRRACAALVGLLLALPNQGTAATISLEEVISTVLERNLNIEKERQNIQRAEAQLRQAKGKFDWQVFADAGVARKEVPDEINGLLSSDTTTDTIFGSQFGVSKTFRNGIIVRPQVSIFRNASNDSAEVLSESVTGVGLAFLVPLLRGAGVGNAAAEELAQRAALKASELSTTFATQKLLQIAVRAYWRCVALKYSLDIQLANAQEIDRVSASVEQLVARGQLPPLIGQELAADQALRRLEINRTREMLFLAQRDLAAALGTGSAGADALPLPVGELPRLANLPNDGDAFFNMALANRSDLKSLEHLLESEDIRLGEAKNSLLPRVDLVLEYDTLQLRYAQSLNANVEQGRIGERTVAVHLAQLNLQLLRQAIGIDVQRVLGQMQLSDENYRLAVETYWLLKRVADDKARQVQLGTTNRGDHVSTLDKLANAHRQVVDANLQYAVGITDIRLITGTIAVNGERTAAELAADFRTLPVLP